MNLTQQFGKEQHGASSYDKDLVFIKGDVSGQYVPLSYLKKNITEIKSEVDLQKRGFHCSSADFLEEEDFPAWFRHHFNKKLTIKALKDLWIYHLPERSVVRDHIHKVHESYEVLRKLNVINNGKNFPVQVGEWYAKSIFGLRQVKSSSQRGFDFHLSDGKRIEVMVHWSDYSSPKGVKLKKSLVDLSQYCVVIYLSNNFQVRDVLLLDSSFILRKFSGKGHTIFLKDKDVYQYFFSQSSKHYDRIMSYSALEEAASQSFHEKMRALREKEFASAQEKKHTQN